MPKLVKVEMVEQLQNSFYNPVCGSQGWFIDCLFLVKMLALTRRVGHYSGTLVDTNLTLALAVLIFGLSVDLI